MPAALRNVFTWCLYSLAFVGCSVLGPDPSIHVTGESSLTWNDVREIERFLPSLGIKYPITEIAAKGPDRADIICEIQPSVDAMPSDEIAFTVVRKGKHWVVIGRPRKLSRIRMG